MAYFFAPPDFYGMRQNSNARFDKQIDDAVKLLLAPAYLKQAREAERRAAAAEARQQQIADSLTGGRQAAEAERQPQNPIDWRRQHGIF
jgi:hypothetical protein